MKRRSAIKTIPSIAIFISGYTPLFLIMIIKDINNFLWFEYALTQPVMEVSIIKLPYGIAFHNPSVVIFLVTLTVLSLILLKYVLKNIGNNPFPIKITEAKSRSSEVVNYTIPYMISFVAFDLSKWQDLLALVIFLSILCLLSIRSQSIFINPILAAIGYGLYDCKYYENNKLKECVMLSQIDLSEGIETNYKKLTNYMGIISNKES
ncbi:MAG: hypothetical protein GQ532_14370 [Methylomarinum sp.]|nr:hypothetical protein [Methylomarinum sp.]